MNHKPHRPEQRDPNEDPNRRSALGWMLLLGAHVTLVGAGLAASPVPDDAGQGGGTPTPGDSNCGKKISGSSSPWGVYHADTDCGGRTGSGISKDSDCGTSDPEGVNGPHAHIDSDCSTNSGACACAGHHSDSDCGKANALGSAVKDHACGKSNPDGSVDTDQDCGRYIGPCDLSDLLLPEVQEDNDCGVLAYPDDPNSTLSDDDNHGIWSPLPPTYP